MPEPMENESVSFEDVAEELQYFGDVPFVVNIQLGERRMTIRDILQLKVGSVINIPKSAGENFDILINGQPLAFGEVAEANEVRITEFNNSD